ncbi:MAG: RNase adapter RapZ [Gammaproteobacteria bacterium]|nr:RNase adapter RapZ [Gammaproteobacteria bacterium]MCW8841255.1 RNase adapter RapZ [Gammaproteobacteria bacterium]MCW8958180.1 RNase adapter RapZ [Gammaproteobacteria bacterium]MCW8973237.1 RNase adapter RapZ [Gammaproteobacteria bacterium]MCW8991743.1 RNase adapter RapZ [Gammaproteobacteria bacterium]
MRLLIISGTSGAGKSVVLHALEDVGCYCIDNLPMALLPAVARELTEARKHEYDSVAVGIDVRNLNNDFATFPALLKDIGRTGIAHEVVFVDASDETLIKRFSETRRRHPLTGDEVPLEEAILQERGMLQPLISQADMQIDTTRTNVHQLRDLVQKRIGGRRSSGMSVLFESFGFKHGIPVEADFVFDVRCLPNPHWEPYLRAMTGCDREVAHFLENHFEVNRMFDEIKNFIESWLPRFAADNRSYLTIAIGCTGGQHRSVYFVERLSKHFQTLQYRVLTRHRELT